MTLFTNPKDIQIGDTVFYEYDDNNIAYGKCISVSEDFIEVDYTTENSTEKHIDNFQKGFWKKQIL
jgi:hypothetical protein